MPVPLIYLAVTCLVAVGLFRVVRVWLRYRGERLITCPENRRPAGVRVDTGHAAASGLGGAPALRLSTCSRWPERAGCGQECLSQIESAPADCLVRNILVKWYQGKTCASCGCAFGEIHWIGAKPARLESNGISGDWSEVPADKLPEAMAASAPLCFACHMANTLVRERPDLVVDRSAHAE